MALRGSFTILGALCSVDTRFLPLHWVFCVLGKPSIMKPRGSPRLLLYIWGWAGSQPVAEDDLDLLNFLPLPPWCWGDSPRFLCLLNGKTSRSGLEKLSVLSCLLQSTRSRRFQMFSFVDREPTLFLGEQVGHRDFRAGRACISQASVQAKVQPSREEAAGLRPVIGFLGPCPQRLVSTSCPRYRGWVSAPGLKPGGFLVAAGMSSGPWKKE